VPGIFLAVKRLRHLPTAATRSGRFIRPRRRSPRSPPAFRKKQTSMSLPQRKLHRLKNWDYSQSGYYFVTICTNEKRKYLSAIRQNGMDVTLIPTQIGQMVLDCWKRIEAVHPNVKLDYYCLMPNHLHGILILEENSDSLSHIIRSFKSVTTRHFNKLVTDDEKMRFGSCPFTIGSSATKRSFLKHANILKEIPPNGWTMPFM
jgi:REP element-mobilizing transposase RayT